MGFHNRLTDVKNYNVSNVLQSHVNYAYDVFDRLIYKQTDPTGGGSYTTAQSFVYDAYSAPLSQGGPAGIALIYDGSSALTDRILNGADANNALADENGSGTISWLLPDNVGTIRDVAQYNAGTNTTTIVDHLKYDAFGNITAQSNSAFQPIFAYTGQMWDAGVGLYYYHARWYDPHTGRFVSQDPKNFAAGDANLYRYVGNNSVNRTDPNGLEQQIVGSSGSGLSGYAPYDDLIRSGGGNTPRRPRVGDPDFMDKFTLEMQRVEDDRRRKEQEHYDKMEEIKNAIGFTIGYTALAAGALYIGPPIVCGGATVGGAGGVGGGSRCWGRRSG